MSKLLPISLNTNNPLVKVVRGRIYDAKQQAQRSLSRERAKQLDLLSTAENMFLEIGRLDKGESLKHYKQINKLEKKARVSSSLSGFWEKLKSFLTRPSPPLTWIHAYDLENIYKVLCPDVKEEKLQHRRFPEAFTSTVTLHGIKDLPVDMSAEGVSKEDEIDISLPKDYKADPKEKKEENYLSNKFIATFMLFLKAGLIDSYSFMNPKNVEYESQKVISFSLTKKGVQLLEKIKRENEKH